MKFKTISAVGSGYVELSPAAVFLIRKVRVIGVYVNEHAVEKINRKKIIL